MDDLIERLEKATGPDLNIDAAIFRLLGMPLPERFCDIKVELKWDEEQGKFIMPVGPGQQFSYTSPAYTASIDAALTLVPEGCGDEIEIFMENGDTYTRISLPIECSDQYNEGWAIGLVNEKRLAPIAICLASIRAQAALKARKQSDAD